MNLKPLTSMPQYLEAKAPIDKLNAAAVKIDARLAEVAMKIGDARAASGGSRDASQVAAALAFAETGQVQGVDNIARELNEEHSMLTEQRASISRAIDGAHRDLERVVGELSAAARKDMLPAHRALAKELLDKLLEVDAIFVREAALVSSVDRAGFTGSFSEYLGWPVIGRLDEQSGSMLWHKVRELRAYIR